MKIELTKEQYINLLTMSHIANSVLGILGDVIPETDYKKKSDEMEKLEEYLLRYTREFDCGNMVEDFHGKILLRDEIYEKINNIVEDYDDYIFWSELETRMGKRDFEREMTEEDKEFIRKNNGWLPEKIHNYYKKYEKEFEENGIENLFIKKSKETVNQF